MSKRIKNFLVIILISILCFILIDRLLNKLNILENIKFIQNLEQKKIDKAITIIKGILSFIIANFLNFLKLYIDKKKETSRISVLINNVTCIKRTRRKDGLLEISLGGGNYFVYVNCTLKNVGECTIFECYINDKRLEISTLSKNESYNFCFKVCRGENEYFKKGYLVKLKYRDDRDRFYEKKFKLEMYEEKQDAQLIPKGQQKRRRK